MGLGKSLGIGLIIYIVLNFLMNMLIAIAIPMDITAWFSGISATPFAFLSNLFVVGGLTPNGMGIITGITMGVATINTNIFLGIMYFVSYIVPALISAIIAGKMADNSKQGFLSWLIISLLCAIVIMAFSFIDAPQMMMINPYGMMPIWAAIVFPILVGLINGLLWSGIAAITAAED